MNKHNAHHVIIIDGHHFKADDSGMWNLTHIWKILGLSATKRPSNWNNAASRDLYACAEISAQGKGNQSFICGTKFATLQYAAWVSLNFNRMVFAAFESILAMPEVATIVANKMVDLGHTKEAELLENMNDAQSAALKAFAKISKAVDGRKPERIFKAVQTNNLTKAQGLAQCPPSSVWHDRIAAL